MDDRYAINLAKTEIREGYNQSDVDRVLRQLARSFTYLSHAFPSSAREEAHQVLGTRLRLLFERYEIHFVPITVHIELLGPAAIAYGWQEMTLTPKGGGDNLFLRLRVVEMWRKLDAAWKLDCLIDNVDPGPALAEDTVAALRSGVVDPLTGGPAIHGTPPKAG